MTLGVEALAGYWRNVINETGQAATPTSTAAFGAFANRIKNQ
jgi:hypothetical protein